MAKKIYYAHRGPSHEDIFREDGTLRGTTFATIKSYKSGDVTARLIYSTTGRLGFYNGAKHRSAKVGTSLHSVYAEMVEELAKHYKVNEKSRMFKNMMNSVDAFCVRYNIRIRPITRRVTFEYLTRDRIHLS